MASGSKKRKQRRRRTPPWTLIWFVLFAGVTVAGLLFSDITEPRMIRIEAAEVYDRDRLGAIVAGLEGVPAVRISSAEVEKAVEENRQVARSSFRANVFGRAVLALSYRKPVAMVGEDSLAMDAEGNIFHYRGEEPPVLFVERYEQAFVPIVTISDPSRLRIAGELAKNLQLLVPKLAGKIALDSRGGLHLMTGSAEVVFGDGDRLARKVEVLAKALEDEPNLLEEYSINLIEPERPMRRKAN